MQPVLVERNWVKLAMAVHLPYHKQATLEREIEEEERVREGEREREGERKRKREREREREREIDAPVYCQLLHSANHQKI